MTKSRSGGFQPLRQFQLLLTVEQGNSAHLLQIQTQGIIRRSTGRFGGRCRGGLFVVCGQVLRINVANRRNGRVIGFIVEYIFRPGTVTLQGTGRSHRLTAILLFFFHFVVFSHHETNIPSGSGLERPFPPLSVFKKIAQSIFSGEGFRL